MIFPLDVDAKRRFPLPVCFYDIYNSPEVVNGESYNTNRKTDGGISVGHDISTRWRYITVISTFDLILQH